MVNIGGYSVDEERQFLESIQVIRKVIVTSGKYVDYLNEIQTSHKLGYPAYRIAPGDNSPTLLFTYMQSFFLLASSWYYCTQGWFIGYNQNKLLEVILQRSKAIEEF